MNTDFRHKAASAFHLLLAAVCSLAVSQGCERQAANTPATSEQSKPTTATVSQVEVQPAGAGPLVIKTSVAEYDVTSRGYVQAFLLRDGQRLTLDDPTSNTPGGGVTLDGKPVRDFRFDLSRAAVANAVGKLGALGKRIDVPAHSATSGLDETLSIEVYDDFPNMALVTASYKNSGAKDITLDRVSTQEHRINASLTDKMVAPHELWSFEGASFTWGQDEVLEIPRKFSRPNLMGGTVPKEGTGGGIPVNAFWTANVGEAIGHIETLPLLLSLPVSVAADQRIETSLTLEPKTILKPGDSFATPRTFVAVYHGDFYEPLRTYSLALQKEGWTPAKPNDQDYGIAWCGWGYEFNVTPAQMLGTIPKLKEMGIKWATLDDRWFTTYGDWDPRPETFPGDSIKKMADDFHKQGIYAQLWWYPLVVEDGHGRWESHKYIVSKVVKEHPDWLVLGKDGKPARVFRGLAMLDPSLPEVQEYYKKLTEKFIRDWGFDGHKLDNIYSVPACYNPKHHHKSPQESTNAMADVYKVIYQTTRALKPESVTQICPCGTTPNLAWLGAMDQAVTADPVGAVQVRRRIKWYKALLGPNSAIYGDHVELSDMKLLKPGEYAEVGQDFASTVGTGGVVGTKFTWGDSNPKFQRTALTPEKEDHWKKWTALYNSKMLSKGEFKDLYVYGYDSPEAYAIEKDGKMYYAFYSPKADAEWKGKIELRGLTPGKYRIHDYANDKDLGEIDAALPSLEAQFTGSLLLEADRE